jgi:hypothetical protein
MTFRDKAIDKAARFREQLLLAEKTLAEAIALAEAEGLATTLDKLARLKDRMDLAHRAAEQVADALAAATGDAPSVYSGGNSDDKGPPNP